MNEAVQVAITALAAYRLWRLIGRDSISEGFRGRLPERVRSWVECHWCGGSWVTFGVVIVVFAVGWPALWSVLLALAAAALVGLVGERS